MTFSLLVFQFHYGFHIKIDTMSQACPLMKTNARQNPFAQKGKQAQKKV